MANLNPQIRTVSIGTRELREVTIYPLSMADQFKMTDLIVDAVSQFAAVNPDELNDAAVVRVMVNLIEDNLQDLFTLILDEDEKVEFSELTNDQFSDIVAIVYEVNYEGSIKKFQDLVGKVKMLLPREKKS